MEVEYSSFFPFNFLVLIQNLKTKDFIYLPTNVSSTVAKIHQGAIHVFKTKCRPGPERSPTLDIVNQVGPCIVYIKATASSSCKLTNGIN